jgi:Flp pilus assembly secretin CpaC/tetratricopeptide (TPR) repeat protein
MAVIELERAVHPRAELLHQFAQGRLAANEATEVEEHLAGCEHCCILLERAPDDSFVGRLRDARDLPPVDTLSNKAALTSSDAGEEPGELADHPRYRLIRLLGRGGMGAVYLAEHRHMARPVALKVINSEILNKRGSLRRFEQEVRTAAKLDHPNIVAAYDADQAGNLHFLVMEYVEGQNLADYLKEQCSMPVKQACGIIRQAARGLQHAHERGMVHRDIKPHNLMLTPSGQVKVLDFGLARFAAEPGSEMNEGEASPKPHLTGAGAVMGSADYIAPEQARDGHAADCRSDIYSLGCTLYHLLANQPPFPEGTAPEKLHRHGTQDPRGLTTLRPEVPNELAKVVAKMMAKRPEDRYQSAAEVAAALTRFSVSVVARQLTFRARVLGVAGLALVVFALAAAAGVVRLPAGDREIVIETDDPTVEVVVKGDRIVRIVDPKTAKAYQLDRTDLTLSLADDPNGLAVVLDGERPLTLKRQGKRIATVRLVEPTSAVAKEPTPSPATEQRQVQLDVIVARASSVEARRLTARWLDVAPKDGSSQQPSARNKPLFGVVNDRDGLLRDLRALSEKGLAKLVAETKVMTLSGRPAWIVSGGETPILTSSSTGASNVTYKQFGTIVNFLPFILRDGKIQLEVRPEYSALDASMGINTEGPNPTSIPGFRTQSAQAAVQMESGKTLVLGGLIVKGPNEEEQEMILLVTPRVIDPAPAAKQQVQMHVTVARAQNADARRLIARWLAAPHKAPNAIFGVVSDRAGFLKDIEALRVEGLAKVLAEPTLVTLSGRPCHIVSGGETPILTTSGEGVPNVSYKTFGTIVNFLPIALGNGKIHLEIRPEISDLNAANSISLPSTAGATIVPGFDLRVAQVAVQMESGKTLVIGGLKRSDEEESETIILVTPLLIDPAPAVRSQEGLKRDPMVLAPGEPKNEAFGQADTYWRLAQSHLAAKDYNQAVAALEKFVMLEKKEDRKAQAYLAMAETYVALGERNKARQAYYKCIEFPFTPFAFGARYQLALEKIERKNYEQALELLKENLKFTGQVPDRSAHEKSIFKIADLFNFLKDYDKAALYYKEASRQYPNNAGALAARDQLAKCYHELAKQALDKSKTAGDNATKVHHENSRQSWLEQGFIAYESLANEMEHKSRQTAIPPTEVVLLRDALFGAADLKLEMHEFSEALRRYESLQEKYPRQLAGLMACHKIWRCIGYMWDTTPQQRNLARAAAAEAVKKAKADLDAMPEDSEIFCGGPDVWSKATWQRLLGWIVEQMDVLAPGARFLN